MSLLNCPECGHEVSSTAVACPNCARPLHAPPVVERKIVVMDNSPKSEGFPAWGFVPIGVMALIVLAVVFFVFSRNSDESANQRINVSVDSNAQRQTATSRPVAPSEPATASTAPSTQTIPGSQTSVAQPTKGKVTIDAKLITRNGAPQAVRNEKFYLLDQDLETVLSAARLEPIEGQTLANSMGLSLLFPDRYGDFNRNALRAIQPHIKYTGRTDGSGKAQLTGIDPNSYYLFGMTKAGKGFAVWNSQVTIQVGDNVLNLTPQNLTEMQDPVG